MRKNIVLKINHIIRMLVLIITFSTIHLPTVFAEQTNLAQLTFNLPKNISETNFVNSSTYQGELNGNKINFTGVPFLKDNVSYVPVRDIANAFQVGIEYNTGDRHVKLLTSDRIITLSPANSFSSHGSAIIKSEGTILSDQQYLLVNNRSYLPLRFIMENLGYTVNYNLNKITIKGTTSVPAKEEQFFSAHQKFIIEALSGYEGAIKISLTGKVEIDNQLQPFQSELTRIFSNEISETYNISIGNSKFQAERNYYQSGTIGSGLYEVLNDNTKKPISLTGYGTMHPYHHLGELELSGIQKYLDLDIKDTGETNGIRNFIVKIKGDNTKLFEVGIDKTTKKLKTFVSKLGDGKTTKELTINY